jgi:hypothetical protein
VQGPFVALQKRSVAREQKGLWHGIAKVAVQPIFFERGNVCGCLHRRDKGKSVVDAATLRYNQENCIRQAKLVFEDQR